MSKVPENTIDPIVPENTIDPIAPENTIDPMEYIPYKLPRDPRKKNERGVYVGVNKLRLFVPYAQTVMIPRCVAEVLDHSTEQDDITANRIMELENSSNY